MTAQQHAPADAHLPPWHPTPDPSRLRSVAPTTGPVPGTPVRVGLEGAEPLIREGLASLLSRVAGRAQLVEGGSLQPSVVDLLLVVTQGSLDDASRIRRLVDMGYHPVIAFGWGHALAERHQLRAAGAGGYVSMELGAADLVQRLEHLAGSPHLMRPGHPAPEPPLPRPAASHGLSRREAEVLILVARGLTNQEIARELFLGLNTVKTYIRGAYHKIGATRRAQAVAWGIDHLDPFTSTPAP